MTTIATGPHYELPSTESAAWVERQGADKWWYVDGDPVLTGLIPMPCPGDEMAELLRRVNRTLLVQAKTPDAVGQVIGRDQIDRVLSRLFERVRSNGIDESTLAQGNCLYLCWKGSTVEWLLVYDAITTQVYQEELAAAKKE